MAMIEKVYTSNSPIDCYLIKGRLETEGIDCIIFDENIVSAHPFYATAIGGLKVMVKAENAEMASDIIEQLNHGNSIDQQGKYELNSYWLPQVNKSLKAFDLITKLDNKQVAKTKILNEYADYFNQQELIDIEKEWKDHQEAKAKKYEFDLKEFCYELFDPERKFFNYLRVKPLDFFLLEDLLLQSKKNDYEDAMVCQKCNSDNIRIDYQIIDEKIVFTVILCLLLGFPAAVFKKRKHCFNCQSNY